ncbi:cation transporter [Candidatus Gottesmanbacteria bacterium]|nr:cation transporter [Candidatus Gottesmanbacteria bacterium]
MIKKTLKLKGMDCPSCAMLIEGELEDRGVTARCSYAKEMVEVEYDEKKISEADIHRVIRTSGYHVVDA